MMTKGKFSITTTILMINNKQKEVDTLRDFNNELHIFNHCFKKRT